MAIGGQCEFQNGAECARKGQEPQGKPQLLVLELRKRNCPDGCSDHPDLLVDMSLEGRD